MEELLMLGARVLLHVVAASVTEEARRQEEAHKQYVAELLRRDMARLKAEEAARVRERRAKLERLKLASPDPRWQERIDLLLATMASG